MFDKKGIGHEVDWILGVGLFIMSVAFIFILFKPGITPVHDSQTLLNIVQDGFEDSVSWEIVQVPIFMAPIYDQAKGKKSVMLDNTGYLTGEDNSYVKLNDLISGKDIENIKLFYVKREKDDGGEEEGGGKPEAVETADDDAEIETEITSFCESPDDEGEQCACGTGQGCENKKNPKKEHIKSAKGKLIDYQSANSGDPNSKAYRETQLEVTKTGDEKLIVPAFLDKTGKKTKYMLVVSDKPINFISGNEVEYLRGCYAKGTFDELPVTEYQAPPGGTTFEDLECHVVYELGVEERFSGVNLALLLGLNELECNDEIKGYDCAKDSWKFPTSREFDIEATSIDSLEIFAKFPTNKPEPPSNVNVFVRRFNSFILTEDGLKIPVVVRLRVW